MPQTAEDFQAIHPNSYFVRRIVDAIDLQPTAVHTSDLLAATAVVRQACCGSHNSLHTNQSGWSHKQSIPAVENGRDVALEGTTKETMLGTQALEV